MGNLGRPQRAVICGYYGKGNGGDEALLATLLQMLPPAVQPVVLSSNPRQTRQDHPTAETCDRTSSRAIWKALGQADAFIWGGGSLIQDATSALSPVYYTGLMGLAQSLNLKTIAWAQGIGPLNRRLTRWLARQTFGGCTAVSVRDRGSAQFLSDWQIPHQVAPDPVWALQASPVPELEDLPFPRVAVALRSHPLLTRDRLTALTQALVQFQTETQACLLLIPFQPLQDLAIAQQIQTQLPGPHRIVSLTDPQKLKGAFQGVKMAIAMRYHGLIMAAAEGCQCFALSYDPKVSQLMQALSLPGWDLAASAGPSCLPESPDLICQQWLAQYHQNVALSTVQIQSLIEQAKLHQNLLTQVLAS